MHGLSMQRKGDAPEDPPHTATQFQVLRLYSCAKLGEQKLEPAFGSGLQRQLSAKRKSQRNIHAHEKKEKREHLRVAAQVYERVY